MMHQASISVMGAHHSTPGLMSQPSSLLANHLTPGKAAALQSPYAQLWLEQADGDTQIEIRVSEQTGTFRSIKIQAHRAVLREGSGYFKELFADGKQFADSQEHSSSDSTMTIAHISIKVPVILACQNYEEAVACQDVIKFLYMQQLPDNMHVHQLCKMLLAAHNLAAEDCLNAVAAALMKALPQISDEKTLTVVSSMFATLEWREISTPSLLALKDAGQEVLVQWFGDVRRVIHEGRLTSLFGTLPLKVIEMWGASDDLIVDSENSVALLLTLWWQRQPKNVRTYECKERLSQLLRIQHLSPSYIQYVVSMLPWYIPPCSEFRLACTLLRYDPYINKHNRPFAGLVCAPRKQHQVTQLQLDWYITQQEYEEVASTGNALIGPEGYLSGYTWQLRLVTLGAGDVPRLHLECYNNLFIQASSAPTQHAAAVVTVVENGLATYWNKSIFSFNVSKETRHVKGWTQCCFRNVPEHSRLPNLDYCITIKDVS